jgi:hydroxycarboxylate dehydrogenase B
MRIDAGRLVAIVAEIYRRAGCSPAEAREVAVGRVDADLVGQESLGAVTVTADVARLAAGELRPGRLVRVADESAAVSVLLGDRGLGQTVGRQAVEYGMERAKAAGSAVVALRETGCPGRIARWAELAADHGFVSVHLASSGDGAPTLSLGLPLADRPPLIYASDAPSESRPVSREPVRGARSEPNAAADGALGLALAGEVLMTALLGGADPDEIGGGRTGNRLLSCYLSSAAFGAHPLAARAAQAIAERLRPATEAGPDCPILLPGDRERFTRADRLENGIPLPDEVWDALEQQVMRLGLHPWSYLLV